MPVVVIGSWKGGKKKETQQKWYIMTDSRVQFLVREKFATARKFLHRLWHQVTSSRCQQLVSTKVGLNICTKGRRGDWSPIFRDVGEVSWDSLYFITIIYCPVYCHPLLETETSCPSPAFSSSQLIVQQTSCMPSIPLRRLIPIFIILLLSCGSSLNNGVALKSPVRVPCTQHTCSRWWSEWSRCRRVFFRGSSPGTLRHGQGHAVGQTCQSQDGTTFKRNPASLSVWPHFILNGSIIYRGTSCCIE